MITLIILALLVYFFPTWDPALNSSFNLKGSVPPEVLQLLDAGDEHLRSLGSAGSNAMRLLRVGTDTRSIGNGAQPADAPVCPRRVHRWDGG